MLYPVLYLANGYFFSWLTAVVLGCLVAIIEFPEYVTDWLLKPMAYSIVSMGEVVGDTVAKVLMLVLVA